MAKVFSIYEANKGPGCGLGSCITDGYDRAEVIDAAEGYYEERAEEDRDFGKGSRDMILVTYDDVTGEETMEAITISWVAEQGDEYDGGRFDYLAGIGAIRSF